MEGTLLESEEDVLFKQFLLPVADYKLAYIRTNTSATFQTIYFGSLSLGFWVVLTS